MNSKISLFVLAAGMGSRYGGLKQMEGFGPSGETIIDYSIYDAVRAGFDKFVFVIRPDMEEAFNEVFMEKYKDKIDISYVFQTLNMLPDWYKLNPERTKPWGTGQAFLVAKDAIKEPCLIINGDDFYGKESFEIAERFLRKECKQGFFGIPTYKLKNVLSENGTVKRGICEAKDDYLRNIEETFDIKRIGEDHIEGKTLSGKTISLNNEDLVSMNMFAIHHTVFENLDKRFDTFLKEIKDDLVEEFLLPSIFGQMIKEEEIEFKILESNGSWFGVTYQEDAPIVREKLRKLVDEGIYPEKLEL